MNKHVNFHFGVNWCFTPQLIRVLYHWTASESIQLETACRLGDAFSGQGGSGGKLDLSAQEEWVIFLRAADGGGM